MKSRAETHEKGSLSIAMLGGAGSGKSYLLHAMAHRCRSQKKAGALAPFLKYPFAGLWRGPVEDLIRKGAEPNRPGRTTELLADYLAWRRLGPAGDEGEDAYRLRLSYSTGWLGRGTGHLDVDMVPGSARDGVFRQAVERARVLLFVLPMWAAFPHPDRATVSEEAAARTHLIELERAVETIKSWRLEDKTASPSVMLVLTMADDARCALEDLQDAWIHSILDSEEKFLTPLGRERSLATYLLNARKVSEYLLEAADQAPDPIFGRVVEELSFGIRQPWILPVSAVNGSLLDRFEQRREAIRDSLTKPPPVPAHVELPLLLALCEHADALR